MPRYYFNLKDGRVSFDNEGTEFANIDAAHNEAVRLSGEILRDGAFRIAMERVTLAVVGYRSAEWSRTDALRSATRRY
jgi:hypothetical protein